jgi:putative peptidoglycan binding protein
MSMPAPNRDRKGADSSLDRGIRSLTVAVRCCVAAALALALPLAVTAQSLPKVYKGASKSKSGTKRKGTIKRKATAKSKAPTTKSRRTVAKARSKSKSTTPPRPRGQLRPSNERYKEIETALASRGYLGEEPSGKWGPPSVEALRAFQADHQLPPTGKLDSLSLIQLGLGPKQ